ncbi:methylmalonyl-CoA mutase subunit beta [Terricaulis sp.]|uniref:methylmalonyl-CoA mutase subunit beta n=1 Tax=Terricaulis sp. TaxID=2768686 RepID=UPI002AC43028|nr:methylmalonyl-CoA mutase subunit beta [Terricaulis sp.]MDZ4693457.1 methylmalonyl-CoA mutase subunit beta [Terricaulis sp.]
MSETGLHLGEHADEADWRALVERGLKGAPWSRLVGETADNIKLEPLYRESDVATAEDVSGMPGAAPFVRGAADAGWTIRQAFEHHDSAETNREILADLVGGVSGIELVIDPDGARGVAIRESRDLDLALADVILEAAPVSLDAGEHGAWAAELLRDKLKGVAVKGTNFGLDPIGAMLRSGKLCAEEHAQALDFTARYRADYPAARFLRADARAVHEAGGTEAQEIATALASGIHYLRALEASESNVANSASTLSFAVSTGPDILVETAKLRALRLCWARVLEASGAGPEHRAAHIHAFTSRRMMTRHDAQTNILRVTTAALAASIGGADDVTTYPFTDALGLPTSFSRRVARNTQNVLMEECRLGHVADPAGGAWFVEKLTRELAAKAWEIMQSIEAQGGIVAAHQAGALGALVSDARAARQKRIATRRETITGVTDFPLLGAQVPAFLERMSQSAKTASDLALTPIRWAAPFEALRDRAEKGGARIFFANIASLAEFGPRAQFARNFFATGGIASIGEEDAHATMEALVDAFRASSTRVAVIASTDTCYAEHAENCAQRLKAAGADWVVLAGKPGESEVKLPAAGVDQFIYVGVNLLAELETLHAALGVRS